MLNVFRRAVLGLGISSLAVLLLVPVSVLAGTGPASARSNRRIQKTRTAQVKKRFRASRIHHVSVHGRKVHKRARIRHAALRHGKPWRHGKPPRHAKAGRAHLEAELDHVRTHSAPSGMDAAETGFAEAPADAVGRTEAAGIPRPHGSTSDPAAQSSSGTPQRAMPVFSLAVPRYVPAALRGSHEVLVHQNIIADVEGLGRIQDDAQLEAMVRGGELVPIPASSGLAVDPRLPMNRRYCRPWTAKFLGDLSLAHERYFGHPLQLTSAVRTVNFQRRLARYNGNAAPTSGDTASPHLTGQAIDLGKKGMSLREIAWMRSVLGQLQNSGKLDVEEEFEQACFHISVYKTYAPQSAVPAQQSIAANEAAKPVGAMPVSASSAAAHGRVAPTLVGYRVKRTTFHRRARPSAGYHAAARRTLVHRRRHHRSISLLAAGLR